MTDEKIDFIHSKFKLTFRGIVENSDGWKELILTKYQLISVFISVPLIFCYFLNVSTAEKSLKVIGSVNSSALDLLGGIVGLSLAGLTLIITFGNQEMIQRGAKYQYQKYVDNGDIKPTYFQKAISKFAFIVFIQILALIVFFVSSIVVDFDIKIEESMAYCINSIFFSLGIHFLIYALILVIALILNLFSFSQQSNEHHFGSAVPKPNTNPQMIGKEGK